METQLNRQHTFLTRKLSSLPVKMTFLFNYLSSLWCQKFTKIGSPLAQKVIKERGEVCPQDIQRWAGKLCNKNRGWDQSQSANEPAWRQPFWAEQAPLTAQGIRWPISPHVREILPTRVGERVGQVPMKGLIKTVHRDGDRSWHLVACLKLYRFDAEERNVILYESQELPNCAALVTLPKAVTE